MLDSFQEITAKLTALKFDSADYVCLKFILLLNPGAAIPFWPDGTTSFNFE